MLIDAEFGLLFALIATLNRPWREGVEMETALLSSV